MRPGLQAAWLFLSLSLVSAQSLVAPDVERAEFSQKLFNNTGHTAPSHSQQVSNQGPVKNDLLEGSTIAFIENRGQFDARMRFQVRTKGRTLWLTRDGLVFDTFRTKIGESLKKSTGPFPLRTSADDMDRLVFREDFLGARGESEVDPEELLPGTYNYFKGTDSAQWKTHVRAYRGVRYREVWKGIDVRIYGKGTDVEQEFVVHAGADLKQLQVAYEGITGLSVAESGELLIHTAFGDLHESRPSIFQEIGGHRVAVGGRFVITGQNAFTFDVSEYRPEYALVIDPTLLYSTFVGGSAQDQSSGVAVDSAGSAYITGLTTSSDFPTTVGAFRTSFPGGQDVFITKLGPLGNKLIYSTYLSQGLGTGIAVDSTGSAYVTGRMAFGGFPTTSTAVQAACGGGAFFSKLTPNGDGLVYSTCLGGVYNFEDGLGDSGFGIATGPSGYAYIVGSTEGAVPHKR